MNNPKNSFRKNQLNSNSTLFLQLGIILALIIVYSSFELKFSKKISELPEKPIPSDEYAFIIPDFTVDKDTPQKKKEQRKPVDLSQIIIDKNNDEPAEKNILFEDPEPTQHNPSLSDIIEVITKDDDEPMPISIVEQAPRYPGCKGKTENEFKKCLNDKIVHFVSRKFNSNLENGTNIQGKQKIYVQFEIDKNGDIIDIKARSPHKALEKEAKRVIGKLPKMIPGKQQNRNVGVRYNLPITFYVQ